MGVDERIAMGLSFLSYYPLKQGLKQRQEKQDYLNRQNFYPTIH